MIYGINPDTCMVILNGISTNYYSMFPAALLIFSTFAGVMLTPKIIKKFARWW